MSELKIIFWFSAALVFYTYAGYPLLLALGQVLRRQPRPAMKETETSSALPSMTLLILACNEERWIAKKIENTLEIEYPPGSLEIVVASDGSTDRTVEIARRYESRGITVVAFAERLGKQGMLNCLSPRAHGEIVVMTDTNALLGSDSLQQLATAFADAQVGCAIGRRVCVVQKGSMASTAESLYWRYESWIQQAESRWHSCLAATGQLHAVRRRLFPRVESPCDDFFIPMKVLASTGYRVAYVPSAVAAIPAAATLSMEFDRKTRTHVSFLFVLPLLKELLMPGRSPVWWRLASHHVLRMLVPAAMLAAIVSSADLSPVQGLYLFLTIAQAVFYAMAAIGWAFASFGRRPRVFYLPFYFVFVQLAVAQAWVRWSLRKGDPGSWQRTERLTDAS